MLNVDICMVVLNNVSHDARVLKEAKSLASAGWQIAIVGIQKDHEPEIEKRENFTIFRVNPQSASRLEFPLYVVQGLAYRLHQILPLGILKNIEDWISQWRTAQRDQAVVQFLKQFTPRIWHAHDFNALKVVYEAVGDSQPIVYDSHELFAEIANAKKLSPIYQRKKQAAIDKEQKLAPLAARVMTVSDGIADTLANTLAIPRPVVVRNAVDIRIGEQATTYEANGRKMVVHPGALTYFRGLPKLVEAARFLPDDIVLILMGNGPLKAELIQQAADLNCQHRILFVPPVPTHCVAATMAQAQAGVALLESVGTRQYDFALPNKFFEGIAAGLPMVTTQNTEIASLMRQYDMGITCDPNNPRQIADAIIEIMQPKNQARYRANVARARQELNWEQEEKKLIDLYQSILRTPKLKGMSQS